LTTDKEKALISQGFLYYSGPCWTFNWWGEVATTGFATACFKSGFVFK
jgi:hypothetical protein